eukprot:COSAG06_NODE_29845_length_549_cov_1.813333_1_plen_74_part_01
MATAKAALKRPTRSLQMPSEAGDLDLTARKWSPLLPLSIIVAKLVPQASPLVCLGPYITPPSPKTRPILGRGRR